METSPCKD